MTAILAVLSSDARIAVTRQSTVLLGVCVCRWGSADSVVLSQCVGGRKGGQVQGEGQGQGERCSDSIKRSSVLDMMEGDLGLKLKTLLEQTIRI